MNFKKYILLVCFVLLIAIPVVLFARLIAPQLSDGICCIVGIMLGWYAKDVQEFIEEDKLPTQ